MTAAARILKRIRYHLSMGPANLAFGIKARTLGQRLRMAQAQDAAFAGRGLEVGGPSRIFGARGAVPVYRLAAAIDNVTFDRSTRWEGRIEAGQTFEFDPAKPRGRQFIAEATRFPDIADDQYDFVVSSHMLEHTANPIAALLEWKRVLRTGGTLLLVLPHRDGSFDRFRPVTPLSHLIEDAQRDTDESDTTHLDEILRLHDFARDPSGYSGPQFRTWIEQNFKNRGAHHHVFDALAAARLIDHTGWQIVDIELQRPHHICVLARKTAPDAAADNEAFLRADAAYLCTSPFATDRAQSRAVPGQ